MMKPTMRPQSRKGPVQTRVYDMPVELACFLSASWTAILGWKAGRAPVLERGVLDPNSEGRKRLMPALPAASTRRSCWSMTAEPRVDTRAS